MKNNLTARKILKTEFDRIRKKNPSFSIRSLSKRLDVNVSSVSRILNGERGISMQLAEKICVRLMLDPQLRMELLTSIPMKVATKKDTAEIDSKLRYLKLTADQYQVIGQWQHYAILSLLDTVDFKSDAAWMASRLGLELNIIKESLDRLQRLELIENMDGIWCRKTAAIRTSDDVRSQSLQLAHKQNMDLAYNALDEVPVELRDFTAITMPSNPELLPKAKELIRKLQDDLSDLMDTKPSTEVYKFCTQLIPLTKCKDVDNV